MGNRVRKFYRVHRRIVFGKKNFHGKYKNPCSDFLFSRLGCEKINCKKIVALFAPRR